MKSRIFLYIFIIFAAISSGVHSDAMARKFTHNVTQFGKRIVDNAKKSPFGTVCTILGLDSAFHACIQTGYEALQPDTKNNAPISNPYVRDFIKEQLALTGADQNKIALKQASNDDSQKIAITIKHENEPPINILSNDTDLKAGHSTLYFAPQQLSKIAELLEKQKELPSLKQAPEEKQKQKKQIQEELNKWKFSIQHEATRMQTQDRYKYGCAVLGIPFLTHFGAKYLNHIGGVPLPVYKSTLSHLRKVPIGMFKGLVNTMLATGLLRYQIKKADDKIKNKDVLQAGAHIFETQAVNQGGAANLIIGTNNLTVAHTVFLESINQFKPHPLFRQAHLKERIAKLEAQEAAAKKHAESVS